MAADGPELPEPQIGKRRRCGLVSEEQKVNKKIPAGRVAMKKSVAAMKEGEKELEESGESQLNSSLSSTRCGTRKYFVLSYWYV